MRNYHNQIFCLCLTADSISRTTLYSFCTALLPSITSPRYQTFDLSKALGAWIDHTCAKDGWLVSQWARTRPRHWIENCGSWTGRQAGSPYLKENRLARVPVVLWVPIGLIIRRPSRVLERERGKARVWDLTIAQLMSVLLISSLGSRTGAQPRKSMQTSKALTTTSTTTRSSRSTK